MRGVFLIAVIVCLGISGCTATNVFNTDAITNDSSADEGIIYSLPTGYVQLVVARKTTPAKKTKDGKPVGAAKKNLILEAKPLLIADTNHRYRLSYKYAFGSEADVEVKLDESGLLEAIKTKTTDKTPLAIQSLADLIVGVASGQARGTDATIPLSTQKKDNGKPDCRKEDFILGIVYNPTALNNADRGNIRKFRNDLEEYCVTIEGPGFVESTTPSSSGANRTSTANKTSTMFEHYLRQVCDARRSSGRGQKIELKNALDESCKFLENKSKSPDEKIRAVCQSAICYRVARPFVFTATDSKVAYQFVSSTLNLPNDGPIGAIKVVRRPWIKNEFELTFQDGMLTNAHIVHESATEKAIKLPIDIAKAAVSVPAALFQFKIASQTDEAELQYRSSLLEAERKLLEEQKDILETQKDIDQLLNPTE